ncbi:MAG: insulinase family protein [candidate division Zixibacteria bacterium]|nr:insulinase family protein [candidate division Zixibacteria bacterium]
MNHILKIQKFFVIILLLPAVLFIFSGCGQHTADEKITQRTLSNGLKVILNENHASPMITSIVMVNAGSKYEEDSTNGFTHFLEHLNFDGSEKLSRIEINEGIKNHGGYINAFTRKDATTYMVLMPSENIDFGLMVQSEQLFNSVFEEDEFKKERKVVTEEIRKAHDDLNYLVELFTDSVLYAGTPYERTVLGSPETIASVSRKSVMEYYKSQYTPENMLAIAIGDFNPDSMIALYEKHFGDEPKGGYGIVNEVNYIFPATEDVQFRETDTEISYLNIAFPAPIYTDPDYYAFDMLVRYLDANETSPLYLALVGGENPLIQSMSVYLDTKKEFTNLIVSVMTDNRDNVDEIIKRTKAVLGTFTQTEIPKEELSRFITKTKVDEYLLEERLHYWGIMKASHLAVGGYDFIHDYVNNLSKVNSSSVKNMASEYFSDIRYVAAAVVPQA